MDKIISNSGRVESPKMSVFIRTFVNVLDFIGTLSKRCDFQGARQRPLGLALVVGLIVIGRGLSYEQTYVAPEREVTTDSKQIAKVLIGDYKQYKCLNLLYIKESNWNTEAVNRSVDPHAYGIPQLRNRIIEGKSAQLQLMYGLKYIAHRYGVIEPYSTPNACNAYEHFKRYGWH